MLQSAIMMKDQRGERRRREREMRDDKATGPNRE